MTNTVKAIPAADLKVGDCILIWNRYFKTVRSLRPHPYYEKQFGIKGAMIANLDGTEMTIEPHYVYTALV